MACPTNPLPPKNARVLTTHEITPKMQAFAAKHAYSDDAIGDEFRETIDGLPIIAWVNWHTERWESDGTRTPGCFHSVTLYLDLAPVAPERTTDWKFVAASGLAIATVVGAFALVLKHAGRAAQHVVGRPVTRPVGR